MNCNVLSHIFKAHFHVLDYLFLKSNHGILQMKNQLEDIK